MRCGIHFLVTLCFCMKSGLFEKQSHLMNHLSSKGWELWQMLLGMNSGMGLSSDKPQIRHLENFLSSNWTIMLFLISQNVTVLWQIVNRGVKWWAWLKNTFSNLCTYGLVLHLISGSALTDKWFFEPITYFSQRICVRTVRLSTLTKCFGVCRWKVWLKYSKPR